MIVKWPPIPLLFEGEIRVIIIRIIIIIVIIRI